MEQPGPHAVPDIQLRPDDIFYIGNTELSIRLRDETQVRPTVDVHSLTESSPEPSTPHQHRTPQSSSRFRGATIMETPSKNRKSYLTPTRDSAKIINTITGIAIEGNEDSQNWPADILKRGTCYRVSFTEFAVPLEARYLAGGSLALFIALQLVTHRSGVTNFTFINSYTLEHKRSKGTESNKSSRGTRISTTHSP